VIFAHAVSGSAVPYHLLAKKLQSFGRIFGLEHFGVEHEYEDEESLEQLARFYAIAITRTVKSPYVVGGWSFGGLLAFELAHQLFHLGQQVALVVIVDCYPSILTKAISSNRCEENTAFLSFVSRMVHPSSVPLCSPAELNAVECGRRVRYIYDIGVASGCIPAQLRETAFRGIIRVAFSCLRAADEFRPGQVSADILWLVSKVNHSNRTGSWRDHTIGHLFTEYVEQDHFSLLTEPCVDRIATSIARRLKLSSPGDEEFRSIR
jgi:thioesterase domain-containing protein